MGLDITIKRIRIKHFNDKISIEENYKNPNAKFVAEFRNIWDWLSKFTITDDEDTNGLFYRFVTKSIIDKLVGGNELERLKLMINSFDFNKYIYIVKFDY